VDETPTTKQYSICKSICGNEESVKAHLNARKNATNFSTFRSVLMLIHRATVKFTRSSSTSPLLQSTALFHNNNNNNNRIRITTDIRIDHKQPPYRPCGFQEVGVLRLRHNRHMKVVRLSAMHQHVNKLPKLLNLIKLTEPNILCFLTARSHAKFTEYSVGERRMNDF
jgi:hypothetical protein